MTLPAEIAFAHNERVLWLRLNLVGVWFLLVTLSVVAWANTSLIAQNGDYTIALAAADRFLQAWQSNDVENGIALLTVSAKKNETRDELERFFTNSQPVAYEINHGKRLKRGRYEFPVVLVTGKSNGLHHKFSTIVIVNAGGNDWAVDKLP